LTMNKIFIRAPKDMRNMAMGTTWIPNHLALVVSFIPYEKWV
jgi:hypothetical protein